MIASYRLSRAAAKSLAEIVVHSDAMFGAVQTAAYVAGIEDSFNLLVRYPHIGATASEIKAGLRRYRYQILDLAWKRRASARPSARETPPYSGFMWRLTATRSFLAAPITPKYGPKLEAP